MASALRFENVSKRYPRGGAGYATLRHSLRSTAGNLASRLGGRTRQPRGTLALDRVSFEVEQGETFGIIGPNGAGKTTALKLASRISYPTEGAIHVRGQVGALIEVGSGVHPELTGRENIWLYGRIFGMRKAEVRARFDEIVEFAELSSALDMPVKMYSSGMQLRLAFAIASHLDPSIFVVDEALAVGDAGFQAKCVERMTTLVGEGKTLVFVSHDLSAVEALCRRGILLVGGRILAHGEMGEVLRAYLQWIDSAHVRRLEDRLQLTQSSYLRLEEVRCFGVDGAERYAFSTGETLLVRLVFEALEPLRRPYVSLGITHRGPETLALCSMLVDGGAPERVEGRVEVSCRLRDLPLLPRVYELWCSVRSEAGYGDIFDWQPIGSFRVTEAPTLAGPAAQAHVSAVDGPVYVAHDWDVRPCR